MGVRGNAQELKRFNTEIDTLRSLVNNLREDKKEIESNIKAKVNKIKALEKKREGLKDKEIIVSEHAILRYFENVLGFDLKEVERKILTDDVKSSISKLGDGKYPIGDVKIVVRGNVVTTLTN